MWSLTETCQAWGSVRSCSAEAPHPGRPHRSEFRARRLDSQNAITRGPSSRIFRKYPERIRDYPLPRGTQKLLALLDG